jgi:hypothetical protein
MLNETLTTLLDWWNTLEPGFRFLMSLPFAVPTIAALGEACRQAWAALHRAARGDAAALRATTAPATRAR